MRPTTTLLLMALLWATSTRAYGAHTEAALVLDREAARPGDTVTAGIIMRMDPRWHTYWKNSGGSGMPTAITWKLPPGVKAGEIQWPIPEVLTESGITTYIYKGTNVLLVPLTLGTELEPGELVIKADVSWLECEVQCVPGDASVHAKLVVSDTVRLSGSAEFLQKWQEKTPRSGNPIHAKASWEGPAQGDKRGLLLEWESATEVSAPDFLPYPSEDYEVQGEIRRLGANAGTVRIHKQASKLSGDWPKGISGVVVQTVSGKREGYEVHLELGVSSPLGTATPQVIDAAAQPAAQGLGKMLLYAFIGGIILNVMPCVLPVIALKILGFVGQARNHPREARKLGLVYGLGVVVSFLALAALVIAAKSAGQAAGWGFQFGNPYFLVVMTTLVTLIALNLFGVFEIALSGSAMDAATSLSSKHGPAGAFFNGLLATVLATSCTAPFLGAAIGFAFAQPPAVVLLVLGTVGLGLAAPYVVLSWQPGWLKFLPKPGPWMERFKVAVGFPMLAAAVWLFSLASAHYGDRAWWLAIFLVAIAVAAWIYGEFLQRHRTRPALAFSAMFIVLGAGYLLALEGQLRWREPLSEADSSAGGPQLSRDGIAWQPWSRAAVDKARAEGRPVLVDFTAKWCLTCNTIVKPALESASVREKIKELNVAAFLGDYTAFPPAITEELNRYGRAGVPLVLVFPGDTNSRAIVLPEALTPGMVVKALEQAVGSGRTS